jgi:DNA-binding beta-propeller fold protein YncE
LAIAVLAGLAGAGRAADPVVTKFDVEAKGIVPCARWADEKGAEVLLLDGEKGTLLKMSVPAGKVVDKKEFGVKMGWMDMSAEGLLISVPDKGELWVLDAKLEVRGKLPVPGIEQAASSPKLSIALVGGSKSDSQLSMVALKTGRVIPLPSPGGKFGRTLGTRPVVAPNGMLAFSEDGQSMIRFAIRANRVTPLDSVHSGGNPRRIHVSADSRMVARPSGGGNPDTGGSYRTAIYSTLSLAKQACAVDGGAYPTSVGFDPAGGKIYTGSIDYQLIVATNGGVKKGEYKIGRETPLQYLAHPDGNKVLVIASDQVSYVELTKEDFRHENGRLRLRIS